MQNKPSGLLSDADFLGKLHRRNPLAGSNEKIHRINPFVKRNMRPLENRSRPHSEVELTGVAAVVSGLPRRDALAAFALRALHAIGPQTALKINTGAGFIRERLEQLECANR